MNQCLVILSLVKGGTAWLGTDPESSSFRGNSMATAPQSASKSKGSIWAGRILSALPVLLMVFGGTFGLLKPEALQSGFTKYGYPAQILAPICVAEILCALVYAVPRTSMFGAILLTAYMGGATATHVRVGEAFFMPVVVAAVAWLGLWLRDERLRALVPWRSN